MSSLEMQAPGHGLRRARDADDLLALRTLWRDFDLQDKTTGAAAVRRLWDCCQIPDFRKVSASEHAALIGKIYHFLISRDGAIPRRLDRQGNWASGQGRRRYRSIVAAARLHADLDLCL